MSSIVFGFVYLILDLIADIYYFWKNNFRLELKKIIIDRDNTMLSHQSLREIDSMCRKFATNKIKSVHTKYFLKAFLKKFNVVQNIQYLIFGQLIPVGGFKKGESSEAMKN